MQILVADDDPVSQSLIVHTVKQAGHSVIQCEDGEQALHVLQNPDGPTLGILDVMMPGLDGIQVCRALRETPNLQALLSHSVNVTRGSGRYCERPRGRSR